MTFQLGSLNNFHKQRNNALDWKHFKILLVSRNRTKMDKSGLYQLTTLPVVVLVEVVVVVVAEESKATNLRKRSPGRADPTPHRNSDGNISCGSSS